MTLSFLGWCWLARPRVAAARATAARGATMHGAAARIVAGPLLDWPALLGGALVLAWMTTLCVNLLRIVAIVRLQPALQAWLPAEQAHRAIGIALFVPALGLQWLLCEPQRPARALLAALVAYALLLLGVPLLTGHATLDSPAYRAQALAVIVMLAPLAAAAGWWLARRSGPGAAAERLRHRIEQ